MAAELWYPNRVAQEDGAIQREEPNSSKPNPTLLLYLSQPDALCLRHF